VLGAFPSAARAPGFPGAAAIQASIDRRVAARKLPGAIVAYGKGTGRPEYVAGGTLDFDSKTRIDENSLWRLASLTKPVTGMATMLLIADGKLRLDQSVAEILPAFARMKVLTDPAGTETRAARSPITIRHLLTHTAGVGTLPPAGSPNAPPPAGSLDEFVDQLAAAPLAAEPGTKWIYASGLEIAARVIEVVSGMAFGTFLEQRLFVPLNMRSTYSWVPEQDKARLVTLYAQQDGALVASDPGMTSRLLTRPAYPRASGGLVSSARDYDRFLAMISGEGTLDGVTVMPAEAIRLAVSNLLPAGVDMSAYPVSGGPTGFGAGASVITSGPRSGTYGWGGSSGTTAYVDTQRKTRLSTYTNIGHSDFAREVMLLAGMALS
jgi:CubicO group peptidase (beta-lactamase class C family)